MVAFLEEKKVAFAFSGYEFADENGIGLGKVVKVPETLEYKEALRNTTIFTSTVMFDTQKIDKVQTLYEGQEIVVYLWEIDPIELPKGSAYAKSTTKEEFSEKYKKAILQGAASAIGGKLWSEE